MEQQNHYHVLGLSPDADQAVIKAAYKAMNKIMASMRDKFLKKYFGDYSVLNDLALGYILTGNREAALEINKAVSHFGKNVGAEVITKKVFEKYGKPFKDNGTGYSENSHEKDREPEQNSTKGYYSEGDNGVKIDGWGVFLSPYF